MRRPDIITDRKLDEDAKDRAWLRKRLLKGDYGTPPEKKMQQAIRTSATCRKKVPVTLPSVKFLKDRQW